MVFLKTLLFKKSTVYSIHMVLKKVVLFLALVLSVSLHGQELRLADAIASALQNNPRIKQSQQKVMQKEYELKAAKGNYLPTVNLLGGYTYLSENIEINMEQVKGSLDDILAKYGVAAIGSVMTLPPEMQATLYNDMVGLLGQMPAYNLIVDNQGMVTANVMAVQPIFMGGKINAGRKYASAVLEESKLQQIQTNNEIIQETINRYLGVLLLNEVVETRTAVLEGMKKHEKDAERLVETGIIPHHTLLRAKVAVANAEQELDDDMNKRDLAVLALKTTMGIPQDSIISIFGKMNFNLVALHSDSLISEAMDAQPILRIIEQKKVMVEQDHSLHLAEFMPEVFAFAEYGMFRNELPIIQPPFILGVQMKLNIFNGFKDYNKLKVSKHLMEEVNFADVYARDQIRLWINKAYRNVLNAQTKYSKLGSTIRLAQSNLNVTEKRFNEGVGRSLDVIDARLLLEGSEVQRLVALYEYYSSLTDLYLAAGKPEKVLEIYQENK